MLLLLQGKSGTEQGGAACPLILTDTCCKVQRTLKGSSNLTKLRTALFEFVIMRGSLQTWTFGRTPNNPSQLSKGGVWMHRHGCVGACVHVCVPSPVCAGLGSLIPAEDKLCVFMWVYHLFKDPGLGAKMLDCLLKCFVKLQRGLTEAQNWQVFTCSLAYTPPNWQAPNFT